MIVSCSTGGRSGKVFAESGSAVAVEANGSLSGQAKALPKAVIYRTNGDYMYHVPVNVDESHKSLTSFPAPSDISKRSVPVDLGDGWYFDRRGGVSLNTVFLTYTYEDYSALNSTPSAGELINAIIPGSAVTQCILTPVLFSEAAVNPEILKKYIPR